MAGSDGFPHLLNLFSSVRDMSTRSLNDLVEERIYLIDLLFVLSPLFRFISCTRISFLFRLCFFTQTDLAEEIKLRFPKNGSNSDDGYLTPPHQMRDFKFKDYQPEVFRQIRAVGLFESFFGCLFGFWLRHSIPFRYEIKY